MSTTNFRANFANMSDGEIVLWRKALTYDARDLDPWTKFEGGEDSIIQRVDDLSKDKGETVVTQIVHDITDGGRVGDVQREGREVPINSDSMRTTFDLLSQQNKDTGKKANQQTIIDFRQASNRVLAEWAADTLRQQRFHVLSGIQMDVDLTGAPRMDRTADGDVGPSEWVNLAWAADITPPSANRHVRISGDTIDTDGDTAAITPTDTLNYTSLVDLHAYALEKYVKGIKDGMGNEYYCLFLSPKDFAALKKDPDYMNAVITGQPRDNDNPFFTGAIKTLDGLAIHVHRQVYNNTKAGAGNMWGAAGDVPGSRGLLLGAQAMVHANVQDLTWVEKLFEYDTQRGISTDMMYGMRKTTYETRYETDANGKYLREDFGVIAVDMARG